MYKLRGMVIDQQTENIKTSKGDWEKMTFTIEESDTGFNHKYQFEIFGTESIELHKKDIKNDNYITVHFYIKSREYNGKYYNTLMVKSIVPENWDGLNKEDKKFKEKTNLPF
tara:strand:+ start:25156 stop:25491 length:336 start_codon:yes stop_codon:yes gene_type:complete